MALYNRKKFIPRQLFSAIAKHLVKPEMTLIVGARQTGKTVLLEMLQDQLLKQGLASKESIFYFNLDLFKDIEFFQSQTRFIEWIKENSQHRKIFIFIDEAQRTPECPRFFKGVYGSKLNAKLILTGSSSLELKARLKESLVGRKRIFHLYSFSFIEFLRAKNKDLAKRLEFTRKVSALTKKQLLQYFKEYAVWGGYPQVVLAKTKAEKRKAKEQF